MKKPIYIIFIFFFIAGCSDRGLSRSTNIQDEALYSTSHLLWLRGLSNDMDALAPRSEITEAEDEERISNNIKLLIRSGYLVDYTYEFNAMVPVGDTAMADFNHIAMNRWLGLLMKNDLGWYNVGVGASLEDSGVNGAKSIPTQMLVVKLSAVIRSKDRSRVENAASVCSSENQSIPFPAPPPP